MSDKSNNLYVISSASHDIHRFSATGADLGVFATVPDLPNDITFDSTGNLDVSNGSAVSEFSSSGTDLGNFVTFNGSIGAIVFNSAGEFYASVGDNIFQFDAKGTELAAFAFPGGGGPTDMVSDENGYLYTSSYRFGNVRKFSANGTDLGIFVALDGAWGLAFAPTSVPETNAPFILMIGIGIGLVCLRRRKHIEA